MARRLGRPKKYRAREFAHKNSNNGQLETVTTKDGYVCDTLSPKRSKTKKGGM